MKNILTILAVILIPIIMYFAISNKNVQVTETAFAKDSGIPTVITFTSTMCMDCQKMKAVISEVQDDYEGKINFVSINALDKKRSVKDAVNQYKIVLVPSIVLLDSNNKEVNKIEGFIPKDELIRNLEGLINE